MSMTQSAWQVKKEICEIGQRIWVKGFCAGNEGNHSVRVGDDRVLCTPTGISKGFLTPEDVIAVDMDGKQAEPNGRGRRPTSEIKVHLAIYAKRPDVRAVVHSHPPHAVAFCMAGMPLPEGVHPEAEVFLGKVPIAKYATPGTHDLPDSILPLIGKETNTVLMGNHGSVNFDKDLIGAYYKLEILDAYCRQLLLARSLGKINTLSAEEMIELLKVKQKFGIPDGRLACAKDGCIGQENQTFFANFDLRPASASSPASGGPAQCQCTQNSLPPGMDERSFDAMVQAITDQIMAASKARA